jgi:hypothetical protein
MYLFAADWDEVSAARVKSIRQAEVLLRRSKPRVGPLL